MKVLVVADEENKALWDYFDPSRVEGVDLILSCGDLKPDYLEFLCTMVNCPVLYVKGNHDGRYSMKPPLGCEDIDGKIYDFHGLRILGLGGSYRYLPDAENQYTEKEMQQRIKKIRRQANLMNGFDILLTHAPAKGYGDLPDLPHHGFECFNELLEKWKPKYMFHGHVHQNYSRDFQRETLHPSGTRIINAYGSYQLEIRDDEHPAPGKTGSALYDLYVSMKFRKRNAF